MRVVVGTRRPGHNPVGSPRRAKRIVHTLFLWNFAQMQNVLFGSRWQGVKSLNPQAMSAGLLNADQFSHRADIAD